jgi:hypothetical protein
MDAHTEKSNDTFFILPHWTNLLTPNSSRTKMASQGMDQTRGDSDMKPEETATHTHTHNNCLVSQWRAEICHIRSQIDFMV